MCALFSKKDKGPKELGCPMCSQMVEDNQDAKRQHVTSHLFIVTDNLGRPAFAFECDRCGMSELAWHKRSAAHSGFAVHAMQRHSMGMDWSTSPTLDESKTAAFEESADAPRASEHDLRREVIKGLCSAVATNNAQMERAIFALRRACGLPEVDDGHAMMAA